MPGSQSGALSSVSHTLNCAPARGAPALEAAQLDEQEFLGEREIFVQQPEARERVFGAGQ